MLRRSIEKLAAEYGIERILFGTLTFADQVEDFKEAQRRYHSLRTHVLSERYVQVIRVPERMRSGRIHYHLIAVARSDIRTGANFKEFECGRYASANAALRAEWAFWRTTAKRFRFGRTEWLPVKSTAEGISRYVGKYISKHVGQREERDKGVRLVEYTRGARAGTTAFAWFTPRSMLWRAKLAKWAKQNGVRNYEALRSAFGRHWAYHHQDAILATKLSVYSSPAMARADGVEVPSGADENAPVSRDCWVDGKKIEDDPVPFSLPRPWNSPCKQQREFNETGTTSKTDGTRRFQGSVEQLRQIALDRARAAGRRLREAAVAARSGVAR